MTLPLRPLIIEDCADDALRVVRELRRGEARARRRETEGALHEIGKFPGTGIGLSAVQRGVRRHARQPWAETAIERDAAGYFAWSPDAGEPIGKNDAVMRSYPEVRL